MTKPLKTVLMKKKLLLRITLGALATVLLLFVALVAHIYMVTPKTTKNDNRQRQLSRIDFKQDINAEEAEKIRAFVSTMNGVEGTHFNVENDVLVYTYAAGTQNSTDVFNAIVKMGNYNAERYVVSQEQSKNGCPVSTDKESFSYRITAIVTNLFN